MKTIEAYQTSDGKLFGSKGAAIDHENDLIGCELDALFDLFKMKSGNMAVGHQSIYQACVAAIKDKQKLAEICQTVVNIIDFGTGSEED